MAVEKYTTYVTYLLKNSNIYNTGLGNSDFIYCNYIKKVQMNEIGLNKLVFYFNGETPFRFLNRTDSSGFSANQMFLLIQTVENQLDPNSGAPNAFLVTPPDPTKWKIFDVTEQIDNHTVGNTITESNIMTSFFIFPFTEYPGLEFFDLTTHLGDIHYPNTGEDKLCFGGEDFFFGNVETEIEALIYQTDVPILLPPNDFNSSANKTWKVGDDVYVTEVGIYDDENNLVAIGKLNDPIRKAAGISRTIIFGCDF
jgi:hypothetical protein